MRLPLFAGHVNIFPIGGAQSLDTVLAGFSLDL